MSQRWTLLAAAHLTVKALASALSPKNRNKACVCIGVRYLILHLADLSLSAQVPTDTVHPRF